MISNKRIRYNFYVGTTFGRLGLFFVAFFTAAAAHGFNKERCGHLFPQSDNDHPYFYAPIYVTTMMPSTTSYFSSIGPCSMYADYQSSTRVTFMEDSMKAIRMDSARGDGEYLKTLAQLSGCPAENYSTVADVLHSQFSTVFAADTTSGLSSQVERIDEALRSEKSLKNTCSGLN